MQKSSVKIEKNTRLKSLILALGLTQREFCERTGLAFSSVSQFSTGDRKITDRAVFKITSSFPSVNADWLLTGDGRMFNDNEVLDTDQEEADLKELVRKQKAELALMADQLMREKKLNEDLMEVLKRISAWKDPD